ENNLYNEYTPNAETTAGSMTARPLALGIPTEEIDGQDVRLVYTTTCRMVERARQGQGPSFLLCNTYRYYGHHVGDIQRSYYRSKTEEEYWKTERDPLNLLARWLIEQHLADTTVFEAIERRIRSLVEAGVEFALNAPYPDAKEVTEDVYA
ncbi:MAG: ABC transporter substrate-binding protein, partial [Chloroflexi bacterium]|nr:ABC transporter substrate-binding protein [Chloroflexota bacterium]